MESLAGFRSMAVTDCSDGQEFLHNIIRVSNHVDIVACFDRGADMTQGPGPFINMGVTSSGNWTLGLAPFNPKITRRVIVM
jgi:hypothetical protein